MKWPNLRIIVIEEGEDSLFKWPENILNKILEENFPSLKKGIAINIQEAYRIPDRLYQNRKSSCHIITKTRIVQNKERILKAGSGKGQVLYKDRPIRITSVFWIKTLKSKRSCTNVLRTLRDCRCQPRLSKARIQHWWENQDIPWQNQV